MDILHKTAKPAHGTMARCHCELLKIPPRSPDLYPIENIFHIVSKKLAKDALERDITRHMKSFVKGYKERSMVFHNN